MKTLLQKTTVIILLLNFANGYSQCANSNNIYSFNYDNHSYKIVKEIKNWVDAANCSVELNGYLLEINSQEEQDAVFLETTDNSGININNTQNEFGTAAVWIGGHDSTTEGFWIWDGNNDNVGDQFWEGNSNGNPVNGAYTNWGVTPAEPDNYNNQDRLTLTIETTHPNFGLWNDLAENNNLFFIIEYNEILSTNSITQKDEIRIYPNPAKNYFYIDNKTNLKIKKVAIINNLGQVISLTNNSSQVDKVDISGLEKGVYFVKIFFENSSVFNYRLLK